MKGILETIPEFFQIIAGIAVALILLLLVFQLTGGFKNSSEVNLSGDKQKIASTIANYIVTCWDQNRNGLSPKSSVCKNINIISNSTITEFDVTKSLNCENIPNNNCTSGDCSSCVSKRYPNQDKVKLYITSDKNFTISYDGYERAIFVGTPEP